MNRVSNIFVGLVFSLLLVLALPVQAKGEVSGEVSDLYVSVVDAKIDQSFISSLLAAAGHGRLYQIKPGSSKAAFSVQGPLGRVNAEFKHFKGGVALPDAKAGTASTLIILDVNSLESDSVFADSLLKSKQLLDAKLHPEITFVGNKVEWISSTRVVLKGKLTMHGVTRPVAFYVDFSEPRNVAFLHNIIHIKATTTISRAQFGLNALSPEVDDKVNLTVQAEAERYFIDPL